MFDHILIPLDGSRLAECALPHAVALAQSMAARVTLIHVLENTSSGAGTSQPIDPFDWHVRKLEVQVYLDEWVERLRAADLQASSALLEGQAAERIIDYARHHDVDLLVISSHGSSGLSHWNISSVAQKILARAHLSTLIVRAYRPGIPELADVHYRRLLVPLDGSPRAECALPLAMILAQAHQAQILVAHVVRRPEMPGRVPVTSEDRQLAERLTERNRAEARTYFQELTVRLPAGTQTHLLVENDVSAVLHSLADQEEVDLVLLSAHGHTANVHWPYGSVAASLIAYGSAPLLIVQDLAPDQVEPCGAEVAIKEDSWKRPASLHVPIRM